jgi:hypothetical protein
MTFQDQGFLLIKKQFPARDPSAFEARLVEIYAEKTTSPNSVTSSGRSPAHSGVRSYRCTKVGSHT